MRVLRKLIEIITTIAEKYPNIKAEIYRNNLRLKFNMQDGKNETLGITEHNARLNVLIKSTNITKKDLSVEDVIELIKQMSEVN